MKLESGADTPCGSLPYAAGTSVILVVEDNLPNQKVFVHQLEVLGHAAQVAVDGQQGLEFWRSGKFDLILADINMPVMDGYQMTAAIRQEERQRGVERGIPIIAATANAMPGAAQRCKDAGMDDYLSKPVALADLERMLKKWLAGGAAPAPGQDLAAVPASVTQAAAEAGAVDPAMLVRVLGGEDRPLIARTLQTFIRTTEPDVQSLVQALAGGDRDGVLRLAHKLKSSARIIGANALGSLYETVERQVKAGALPSHAEVGPNILEQFEQVRRYVEAYTRGT